MHQRSDAEVFNDIYGEYYSKASISRMLDYLRRDVTEWLERSLESYYPLVFIDCVHIRIHRKRSADAELSMSSLPLRRTKPGRSSAFTTSLRKALLAGERC